jgi:hypothetical protein
VTPPRSLDTAIAEATRSVLKMRHESWPEFEIRRAVAVRRAVCDWLREDEGAVEAAAQAHWIKGWQLEDIEDDDPEFKLWGDLHEWGRDRCRQEMTAALAALLAYMERGDGE